VFQSLHQQLSRSIGLTRAQVTAVVEQLIDETIPSDSKAEFLTALAQKGETADEIAGFARELREKSVPLPLDTQTRSREILDVCGTGGDRLNTFNISTTVALIAASAGVTVAKHGNRAITSQAGSADVLEKLGVRIDLKPHEAADFLRDHHFAFLFAPHYHPAFKHIAGARKLCADKGQRTIFNFLGPLLNPVRPTAQLVGVPRPELCEPVGHVLQMLGAHRGMVACGAVGRAYLDEFSTLGPTVLAEFYQERGFSASTFSADQFPLQKATLEDLRGGDAETNARIIRAVLSGEDRGPKRDAVLLNSAAALFVAGRTTSIVAGWELAAEVIDSGCANAKLEELVSASGELGS
jgi:anthranilate phosphoribosyltransferase